MQDQSATARPVTSKEYLRSSNQAGAEPDQSEMNRVPDYASAEAMDDSGNNADFEANYPNEAYAHEPSRVAPGMYRPRPEQEILAWEAPSRPFKAKSRRFFTTIIVIGLLVSLILFFAGQVLPVAVIFSLVFMAYAFSVVPPTEAQYKITTYGIRIQNELFYWEELGRFWFESKYNQPYAQIELSRFPGRIMLMLGDIPEDALSELLSEVLLKERPPLTQFEKMGQWLERNVPLDVE